MEFSVLIAGAGSIGTRHAKNLESMGIKNITTCDPNGTADFLDITDAIATKNPNVILVCSPSKFHVEQAKIAASTGAHIFIEKPISNSLDGIEELVRIVQEKNLTCMVGCNMRFHHGPTKVKELIEKGVIGSITSATVYTGSYLPDWRPQSNYKESYSADPEQGGALLDCIHEIDLALWYFGPATIKSVLLQSAEPIEIETEGTADLVLQHSSGCTSNVHLSYMEKDYKRFCIVEGERGSIRWDFNEKKVELRNTEGDILEEWKEPEGYDFNDCYIAEIAHFFECVEKHTIPQGNLDEAAAALTIALTARNS
jgi:predicted dehydrogenase